VAARTRDRVQAAAEQLDYVASPFATRLATGRSSTLGVVVPFVSRWYFAEILGAVESCLTEAGYDLLLHNLSDLSARGRFFATLPFRKRVDAVLIVSLVLTEPELAALHSLKLPLGVVGAQHEGAFSVGIDDVAAALVAVRHLLELGHRRIGLIGGDVEDPMRFTPPKDRRDGYLQALNEAGIAADPSLERLGYFTIEGGEAAMLELLAHPDGPPSAVFAESDEMAFGAIRAIRRAGLRLPEDIAVIGFDDHSTAALMDLSTVRQPVHEQATQLTTALLAALLGDEQPIQIVLPTELIVRGSTVAGASEYAC
jgi:LacI family transcriptional regulator, repressor for deo operon, udp, cdd, tsx, nupC, and nupG